MYSELGCRRRLYSCGSSCLEQRVAVEAEARLLAHVTQLNPSPRLGLAIRALSGQPIDDDLADERGPKK